ncbi:MAG: alkene reductase [Rickettsiales bacterium]|nr:alkene reductase [Rickettsiales bacterium]
MKLEKSYELGNYRLPHRVVMAPMTRSRTTQPGNIPNALMASYYKQRAAHAAIIITEATQISQQGQGYSFTPGIHSKEQIEGWKLVTDAVHQEGGKIFLQLWHVGRLSHEMFHNGEKPVAPSAIEPNARIWAVDAENPKGAMFDCPEPRALSVEEIKTIIQDFRQAAANAIEAGFDGVEIHGANGYLLDQFMRRTSNIRTDEYGGDIENRVRFMLEVAQAVAEEVGADRTGIRLAPFIKQRGMDDDEAIDAVLYASKELGNLGLLYIHLAEADWDDAPQIFVIYSYFFNDS